MSNYKIQFLLCVLHLSFHDFLDDALAACTQLKNTRNTTTFFPFHKIFFVKKSQ